MPDQDIQLALPSAVGPARPRPAPRLSLEVASPAGEACVSLPFVMSTEEVVAVDPKLRVLGASRPRAHRTCKVGVLRGLDRDMFHRKTRIALTSCWGSEESAMGA